MGLCFPIRVVAMLVAMRPITRWRASTTCHTRAYARAVYYMNTKRQHGDMVCVLQMVCVIYVANSL